MADKDTYIPKYIRQTITRKSQEQITAERWNELWNLSIIQGDYNAEILEDVIKDLQWAEASIGDITMPVISETKEYTDEKIAVVVAQADVDRERVSTSETSITQNYNEIQLRARQTFVEQYVTYKVEIFSTQGKIFKNGEGATDLIARVYKGTTDITAEIDANNFKWTRVSADPDSDIIWNNTNASGTKQITVTDEDVHNRATFNCEILSI